LEVAVIFRAGLDSEQVLTKEFGAALRAGLANFVTVVPEGVKPPPHAMHLRVEIDNMSRKKVSAAAVGIATGVAVALLSAASGNSKEISLFDAAWIGTHTGAAVSESQEQQRRSLGYRPPRINASMYLRQIAYPKSGPIYAAAISSRAIVDELPSIKGLDRYDPAAINEAIAQAFARAVIDQLHQKFGWSLRGQPSWYEPEEGVGVGADGDEERI
jgi:hypothetical protein